MSSSDVISGGLQGGIAGASTGASVGGPWGAVIGGVVGTVGGAIFGGRKKKTVTPKFASSNVYGYDTYGNLISRGSFRYNKATGQYELAPGELSPREKAMRQNLAGNIEGLINTVGSTPDAFVRYAKELSNSYYNQAERQLTREYDKAQAQLDENLARRGMSTSRAAADLTSEMQRKRFDTLADVYDASQRYGFNAQNQLMGQAQSSLGVLSNYQNQLGARDISYLQQALTAQQIGQNYENMKAGIKNQQIAQENQNWQNVLDAMTSAGMSFAARGKGDSSSPGVAVGYNDQLTQNIQNYGAQNMPWSTFGGYYGGY